MHGREDVRNARIFAVENGQGQRVHVLGRPVPATPVGTVDAGNRVLGDDDARSRDCRPCARSPRRNSRAARRSPPAGRPAIRRAGPCRSVPMKALLVRLSTTGSPGCGATSGLKSLPRCPDGRDERHVGRIRGGYERPAGAARARRRAARQSPAPSRGWPRRPQTGSSMAFCTSMTMKRRRIHSAASCRSTPAISRPSSPSRRLGAALADDAAVEHHQDAVGQRADLVELDRDEQHRLAARRAWRSAACG